MRHAALRSPAARISLTLLAALLPAGCPGSRVNPLTTQPLARPENTRERLGGVRTLDPSGSSPYMGGGPRCLRDERHEIPVPCRAPPTAWRIVCDESCVSRRLPEEAERGFAAATVHVTYTVGRDGILDAARSLYDPGCGFGAAAPATLRACCNPVNEGGGSLARLEGQQGCHALEFRYGVRSASE